jgi:glycosyltransferase involved in cell wall biosynthesis
MISILITHYNRYDSLINCLEAFSNLKLKNVEYVISDDCSSIDIQEKLKKIDVDKLIISDKNSGLASNLNRGLKECKGNFILYCQEDFIPSSNLLIYINEAKEILSGDKADMCRLKANYKFPKLIDLSDNFKLIPKFSWRNFYYNTFQYSDNPFITHSNFFKEFGYFMNDVSGAYGENEYAIRIMKSNARIAISNTYPFKSNTKSESVILHNSLRKKRSFLKKLRLHRLLRAVRLHFEFLIYNKNKRGLFTIKNGQN